MDLSALLRQYPNFREGAPVDNSAILQFFNASEMKGGSFNIRYERDPDFFAFLRQQSPEGRVYLGERKAQLQVVITHLLRPGYVNGQLTQVGYLGDVRSRAKRELAFEWRMFLGDLLHQGSHHGCVIMDDNVQARATLIDHPRSPFYLHALGHYQMVNLFIRAPWARKISREFLVSRAGPADTAELLDFLEKENKPKPFGFAFRAELPRRLSVWPNFSLESFYLARSAGEIVGCFAPWSPSPVKRVVVESLPALARIGLGALHSVFPGVPAQGKELKISYLTHLEIDHLRPREDREEIFRTLLESAFKEGAFRGHHMAAFSDFRRTPLAGGMRGYITQRTAMTYYQVIRRDSPSAQIPVSTPAFEMSLV